MEKDLEDIDMTAPPRGSAIEDGQNWPQSTTTAHNSKDGGGGDSVHLVSGREFHPQCEVAHTGVGISTGTH